MSAVIDSRKKKRNFKEKIKHFRRGIFEVKELGVGESIDMQSKAVHVAIISITAALYIALGYVFQPISFLGLQFRLAEIVVGMVIIYPRAGLIGNIIGVFFVNLTSPLGPLDLISVAVNVPALYAIIVFREYKYLKYVGGLIYAATISLYVAILLSFILGLPFILMFCQVMIAEVIITSIGIYLFSLISKELKVFI